MRYRPTADHVLVRLDPRERTFGDSGLVRPDIAEEMPVEGTVVARGPGRWSRKRGVVKRLPMTVQAGDRVSIPWATGAELSFGGVYHRQVREDDVLGFVE